MTTQWIPSKDATKRLVSNAMPLPSPEEMACTNVKEILSITGSFFATAVFIVLLRCYVRLGMLKTFGKDDCTIVVAMAFAAVTFACFVIETQNGLGKSVKVLAIDLEGFRRFAKTMYLHSLMVMIGISCVKISIAFALLRLSVSTRRTRFIWSTIVLIIMITIACAGTLIFQCLPVQAAWDFSLRPPPTGTGSAKCFSIKIFRNIGLLNSLFNVITDILFATLPVPLIWKLRVNIRTKVSLIVILSLGWFACGAAIVKAVQQWTVLDDLKWTEHASFVIWNYIEFTIGIIATSLPALKPIFNWALNTARSYSHSNETRATSRPSAFRSANSLGFRDIERQSDQAIPMRNLHHRENKGEDTGERYKVRVSQDPMGKANKDAWDLVHAKNSEEILRMGPRDITMTREILIT